MAKHALILAAVAIAISPAFALATDKVYTPPVIPPGVNSATVPSPKMDWLMNVQDRFDHSQAQQPLLVFDGDSTMDLWRRPGGEIWKQRYAPLNAFNFANWEDRLQNILWRLQKGQMDGLHPKLVVLMMGTNNLGPQTPEQVAEGIKVVVSEYLKDAPTAHILLLGIMPKGNAGDDAQIKKINSLIAPLDDGKRVTYLDIGPKFLGATGKMLPDASPGTPKSYQIWADAMQPEIDKTFPKSE